MRVDGNIIRNWLCDMKFPLSEHDADDILAVCVYNGYEEVLKVLLEHHALGALFRARGGLMKRDTFPWTCWRSGKRRRMAKLLAGEGINFRIQMNDVH